MLKDEVNSKGGLEIGGRNTTVNFYEDNSEAKAESAVTAALKLIKDEVLAMIEFAVKQAVRPDRLPTTMKPL